MAERAKFRVMAEQMHQCKLASRAEEGRIDGMICFSLFGVRVTITPTFWLTLLVLGCVFGAAGVQYLFGVALFGIAALLSLLTHEMGHALVGRTLGGGQPEVCLTGLGGDCCNAEAKLTRTQGVVMTAAGPVASVLLGLFAVGCLGLYIENIPAACYIAMHSFFGSIPAGTWELGSPYAILFFINLMNVCFWWSIFNLLPVFPLDGGQIMHGLLDSPKRMHFLSLICACLLTVLFLVLGIWLLAIVMVALAFLNYRCRQQAPY